MMKFSETPGHLHLKDSLRRMADASRIPHALMLSGSPGLGKLSLARAFAQYVHCTHRSGGEPCGHCPSCLQHAGFNHPDVHFTFPVIKPEKGYGLSDTYLENWKEFLSEDPYASPELWLEKLEAGNKRPVIYVDESEEIIRKASLSPFAAAQKIFIIWQPEKLNPEAANKLLKVIEEPSADTVFVLVSNQPGSVLPTIFSRTQRFSLSPLSPAELSAYVRSRFSMSSDEIAEVVKLAEGSPARALRLAREGGTNAEFASFFRDMMRASYAKKVADLRTLSENASALGREKLCRMLDYFSRMVRENFIYNLHVSPLVAMTREEEQFSQRFAPFIHAGNVEEMSRQTDLARRDVERNANSKLVMFDYMMHLTVLIHRKSS